MLKKGSFFIIISLLAFFEGFSQCTTLGQNPSTAFPVCGTTTFVQNTVPLCSSNALYVPGCTGSSSANYENRNPFWYKFTCYQSGTLGFVINPNNNDDYDWQLYDVTGLNPDDVYTNTSIIVSGNWSGTYGPTGASASGVSYLQCASDPTANEPTFAQMPNLIAGHNYLLLVSHFTDTQFGYSLSFGGGTAVITDPKDPHLDKSRAICDGTSAAITLNKRMKCNSLTATGSEFSISPAVATVIAASGYGCSNGFDMDSVNLTFSAPLPPGNYTIIINKGTDGNTLLDNCGKAIPDGETIPMVVYPVVPTPMDSLTKVKCAPDSLQLVFRKGIRCSSLAADGTDFDITGPTTVTVTSATANCDADGLSKIIIVHLSAPIQTAGTYIIRLKNGSDGNTLVDECAQQTPAGSFIPFVTKDTVNADFSFGIRYGCRRDTVDYVHDGRNGVNVWKWNFDNLRTSNLQSPSIIYGTFGLKHTQLIVSNGVCSDTSAVIPVMLDNELKAEFEGTAIVCPGDRAHFVDKSTGHIISWNWIFGNGNTSNLPSPPDQTYPTSQITQDVPVKLIITNNLGCKDSMIHRVKVAGNCYIAVAGAFTPNGDGLNDFLYPINAYKAQDLIFRVFNRFGQMIFETRDWTKKWDGTFKGQGADPATYVWMLEYTDGDSGKRIKQKGTSILIR